MLQALNEDMSLSGWSMPLKGWQKSSCTGVARHLDSLPAHPLCWLCSLVSVQMWQTRSEGPRWVLGWCLSPVHSSSLLKWPQVRYHALYICCSFSVVLWRKVPVLEARMAWGRVACRWSELCLFGMGVALGPQDGTNGQLFTPNLRRLQASWSFVLRMSLLFFLPPPLPPPAYFFSSSCTALLQMWQKQHLCFWSYYQASSSCGRYRKCFDRGDDMKPTN